MTPPKQDTPAWQGRGVGNVIPLDSHPKHSTRRITSLRMRRLRRPEHYPLDPRSASLRLIIDSHLALVDAVALHVRLFLGPCAVDLAIRWCEVHGEGTAWALSDDADPRSIPWPAGTLVKVIHDDGHPRLLERLVDVSQALRESGVAYAAFDHQQGWPNLWARDVGGGA